MLFGLRNMGTFQWMIDQVLQDLPFVFKYLDDILIASSSSEEHIDHLKVFKWLSGNSLIISLEKCVFGADPIDFLGHHISQRGCSPHKAKMDAIQSFSPPPKDSKQLQQFLRTINFYRKFMPNGATLLKPPYEADNDTHKKRQLNWTSVRILIISVKLETRVQLDTK